MQLIPKPRNDVFVLFPDLMNKELNHARSAPPPEELHVPYDCLVAPLECNISAEDVHRLYQSMLEDLRDLTRVESQGKPSGAHNVVMTTDWMCVIPRQSRGEQGVYTNAMGMMGLVCEFSIPSSVEERNN